MCLKLKNHEIYPTKIVVISNERKLFGKLSQCSEALLLIKRYSTNQFIYLLSIPVQSSGILTKKDTEKQTK